MMTLSRLVEKFAPEKESPQLGLSDDGHLYSVRPPETFFGFTYHAHMIPPFRPEHTLILGYGGGTVAELMRKIWGNDLKITGVDLEYQETGFTEYKRETGDAFEFVKSCSSGIFKTRFDYICVDLFDQGKVPDFVFIPEFAIRLKEICTKLVSVNTLAGEFKRLRPFHDYGFNFERHVQIFGTMVSYWSPIKDDD